MTGISDTDPGTLRVDFHTHTIFSSDSLTLPEKLVKVARRKMIDRVVITDHNQIEGAFRAQEIDPELIIVGSEIETSGGEILAAYMTEAIPRGLPPLEVITRLREQNAFISISHPFDPTRKGGWQVQALVDILPYIDAIETFNSRCMLPHYNWKAEKFAHDHHLLGTHGSDAHAAFEIGRGSLLLPPFSDAASLKASLVQAISPRLTLSPPWIHLTSRFATMKKKYLRSRSP
jgi:predicted metal-dependent phosphoesterase TrpH